MGRNAVALLTHRLMLAACMSILGGPVLTPVAARATNLTIHTSPTTECWFLNPPSRAVDGVWYNEDAEKSLPFINCGASGTFDIAWGYPARVDSIRIQTYMGSPHEANVYLLSAVLQQWVLVWSFLFAGANPLHSFVLPVPFEDATTIRVFATGQMTNFGYWEIQADGEAIPTGVPLPPEPGSPGVQGSSWGAVKALYR